MEKSTIALIWEQHAAISHKKAKSKDRASWPFTVNSYCWDKISVFEESKLPCKCLLFKINNWYNITFHHILQGEEGC